MFSQCHKLLFYMNIRYLNEIKYLFIASITNNYDYFQISSISNIHFFYDYIFFV